MCKGHGGKSIVYNCEYNALTSPLKCSYTPHRAVLLSGDPEGSQRVLSILVATVLYKIQIGRSSMLRRCFRRAKGLGSLALVCTFASAVFAQVSGGAAGQLQGVVSDS